MTRTVRTLPLALVLALVMALMPTAARAQVPVPDEGPIPEDVPSFNESPGCDALDGIRGPTAEDPGRIEGSEPIYGPWADFYGRTMVLAWGQAVAVRVPFMSPGTKWLYIHERVLPAFQMVVDNLIAQDALGNRYTVYDNYTWSWSSYTIPPKRHFSFHAVGAAIDINSNRNPYRADNVLITNIPDWFVDAWRDAGWCWGGDWQTIKDTMHFAWKGPLHTPGYVMPPPQPPLVAATAFNAEVPLGVVLPPNDGHPHLVADLDRDGAVDVVRLVPVPTGVALVTAAARYRFAKPQILARTAVAPTDASAPADLADLSRDGRPDLVYLLDDGGMLSLEVFPLVQSGVLSPVTIPTSVPHAADATYLFDDLDRDGYTDLFVVASGDPAHLEVWLGPDFTTATTSVDLGVGAAGHRFDTGDRNVDGIPDVFALADDGSLTVHLGSASFAPSAPVATGVVGDELFFVEDLDGDGHSDFFLVGPDGSARLRRGGASTHDPSVWYAVEEIDVGGPLSCITSPFRMAVEGGSVALVDPATGIWCMRGGGGELTSFYYGNPGDSPFMGDWDCDGIDTPGLYRRSDGYVYLRNSSTQGVADVSYFFGNPGDIPLAGDFDGDGCDTVGLYRPADGRFYIINRLGSGDAGLGAAEIDFVFGDPRDVPFAGDFDGDGTDTVGMRRSSDGFVSYRNSHGEGPADGEYYFGNPGDVILMSDWDADGDDSPGVFRPSTATFYFRYANSTGVAQERVPFGEWDWFPVAGRFGA